MTWRIICWDQAADSGCGEKNVEYDITMIFAREDWVTNYQSDVSIGNNIEISGGLKFFLQNKICFLQQIFLLKNKEFFTATSAYDDEVMFAGQYSADRRNQIKDLSALNNQH